MEVVEPYLSLELARVAIEQGNQLWSAKVKHHRPFEEVAKIKLQIPFGLEQVDEVLLESNDEEISLPLIASADPDSIRIFFATNDKGPGAKISADRQWYSPR